MSTAVGVNMPHPGETHDGLPLSADEVAIRCASNVKEVVLSRATLDCDDFRRGVFQRFANPVVEADFALFHHTSRAPLMFVALLEAMHAPVAPSGPGMQALVIFDIVASLVTLLVACLLTDAVAAHAAKHAPCLVVSRTRRAFFHELLVLFIILTSSLLLLKSVYDRNIRFGCHPVADAASTGATGIAGCDVIGFGDTGRFTIFVLIAPPRVVALAALLPVLAALAFVTQTQDIFGPEGRPFFDVETAELVGRCVVMALEYVVVFIICATRERRQRSHFETAVEMAATARATQRTNGQRFAMQRLLERSMPGSASTEATDRLHMGYAHPFNPSAHVLANTSTQHARLLSSTSLQRCVVFYVDLVDVSTPTVVPLVSRMRTANELRVHMSTIDAALREAGDCSAMVCVTVCGDALFGNSASFEQPDDPDRDAPLQDAVEALGNYCFRIVAGVANVADCSVAWRGCAAARGAVAIGGCTITRRDDDFCVMPWPNTYQTVKLAALSGNTAPGRVVAVGTFVRNVLSDSYTMPAMFNAPGTRLVLHDLGQLRSVGSDLPTDDSHTQPSIAAALRPATLEEATASIDCYAVYSEVEAHSVQGLQLTTAWVQWCGAAACARSALLATFFPRFTDDKVEASFVAADNMAMRSGFMIHGVAVVLTIISIMALLGVSGSLNVATGAVGVVCLLVAIIVVLVLQATTVVSTVQRGFVVTTFLVLVFLPAIASAALEPRSQAARDMFALLVPVIVSSSVLLPEHHAVRLPICAAVGCVYNGIVYWLPPPGHDREVRFAWIGVALCIVIAVAVSRAARAQYSDVHMLEVLSEGARQATRTADAALIRVLPPFISAALRAQPAERLCHSHVSDAALVCYADFDVAMLAAVTLASSEGYQYERAPPSSRALRALDRLLTQLQLPVAVGLRPGQVEDRVEHQHALIVGDALLLVDFDGAGSYDVVRALDLRVQTMMRRVRRFCTDVAESVPTLDYAERPSRGDIALQSHSLSAAVVSDSEVMPVRARSPSGGTWDGTRDAVGGNSSSTNSGVGVLRMRCVVHCGRVAAAVVASAPYAFAMIGPAITTAQRIATGAPYRPQILITDAVAGVERITSRTTRVAERELYVIEVGAGRQLATSGNAAAAS